MRYSREQVNEVFRKKRAERMGGTGEESLRKLQFMARAAVNADKLVNDPAWDVFLSYLQAVVAESEEIRDVCRGYIEHPKNWDEAGIREARAELLLANERIRLLNFIMELPVDIKAQGEKAVDLVSRLAPDG